MIKEAEKNKEADEKRKEEADLRNEAEQMIFMTEKSIKDLGDKVSDEDKETAEKLVKELKEALEGEDIEDIKTKKEALQEKAMELGAKVYEEAAKNAQAESNDEDDSKKKDDGVVDAEFEE